MFIFGILSTPLPYFVIAFVYLMGLGMGLFQKHQKVTHEEEFATNIVNYEVLSPAIESITNEAHYHDYSTEKNHELAIPTAFFRLFSITIQHIVNRPPGNQVLCYQYIPSSNLFNRPPPVRS
jgi:hypothetical protein